MGRAPKTVHTPEPERLNSINFAGAQVYDVKRSGAEGGSFKFRVGAGSGLAQVCKRMGWEMPGEKTTVEKFEGRFIGGHVVLQSQDKLVDAEVDIEYVEISGFELHRLEVEGKRNGRKTKTFRRELRFSGGFKCVDGAANFESYMVRTNNAKGVLRVTYMKEEVQADLPLADDKQASIPDDVMATDEQREAVTQ